MRWKAGFYSQNTGFWDIVSRLGHLLIGQLHLSCLCGLNWIWKGLAGRSEWEFTFVDYLIRQCSKQQRRKGDNTPHGDTRSAMCIPGTILCHINVSCFSFLTSLTSYGSFPRLTAPQDTGLSHVLGLLSQVVHLGTPYPKLHWCNPELVHVTSILSSHFFTHASFLFPSPKT